jgi:hypothetical protein
MGIIFEPKGIDFVIQNPPLSDEEKKQISLFIKNKKAQSKKVKKLTTKKEVV